MTKYKRTDFEEDETSSNGSVLAEGVIPSLGPTRIVYHKGNDLWNARSQLEKILLILAALLVLVVIILSSFVSILRKPQPIRVIYVDHHNQTSNETAASGINYCLSPECITVASSVINAMDLKVKPCQDFYQYACGGWIKANPIPEGKSIWGTFGKLWQENQLVMKNVLEQNLSAGAGSAERKSQIYYLSCMDRNSTMEKLGAKPMTDLINKVGGWNISGVFDVNKWTLQSIVQTVHNVYNMGGLFSWAVGEDDRNSSRHIMQIDQGGLTLPTRDYYLNKSDDDKVLVAYLTYMTDVGVLLGGEKNSTRLQMKHVIEFETELANITTPSDERRNEEKLYHKMNISELNDLAPFLDWVQYFNVAFKLVDREIQPTDVIVVYAPDFLRNLSAIIQRYNTTEGKIVLNNYLVWQMIRPLIPALSKPFRDAAKILQKALVGTEGGEDPWRFCVSDTNTVIGFALGAMFVREVFHGESKPVAEEMIEEIRTAFKKNLEMLEWMDTNTKRLAKEKADAITDMIGFPDYILNTQQLDEKYSEVQFNESEYFANNIAISKFALKKNLERLDKPVNKTRWGMSPPTVNAYYTPTKNQIVFPAGILQAPFYDINYPRSLNFGAMGVVMGHELTHAFDDQGGGYDKLGNLHQWWENATMERFQQRTQCMVDQYSNFTENGENLNGKQTLGENIADNGGLKAAFKAYEDWISVKGEELPLPGVNLTHRQLFFLGFSQVWCSASTNEATHLQIMNDPHSLSKFRVLGPLRNSYDFAKHFNCAVGSPMNPFKKCEIW